MRLNKYYIVLVGLMLAAIILRLVNHQYQVLLNFSPIAAIALFGSANIRNKMFALLIPMLVMFASDCFIGFHKMMFFTYGSFILISLMGNFIFSKNISTLKIVGASLLSSIIFFVFSNLGVWLMGGYVQNMSGLAQCYINAIPFFGNTVGGDLFYCTVLFGAFEYIKQTNWLVKAKA